MDRLRLLALSIFASSLLAPAALGEANPYDTQAGYYNTKGAYSDDNSDAVKARVNGLPGTMDTVNAASETLKQQEQARQQNAANCPDPVQCQRDASRLPASLADAMGSRPETYQGGTNNTGLVGLDEKLVEVERLAGNAKVAASTAAANIEIKLANMTGYKYDNPNSIEHATREALREELAAQERTSDVFAISEDWANRGYRTLVANPDDSPAKGNGSVAAPAAGSVTSNAPGSKTPGEIANVGAGPNGTPSEAGPGPEYTKAGAPGTIDSAKAIGGSTLEQGRQMAYDILRAEGITPVGSLRAVGIDRGELSEASAVNAGEMKKPGDLASKSLGDPDELLAARLGLAKAKPGGEDDEQVTGPGAGRGARARRGGARSVTAFDDEEPPMAVLRGLSASELKNVKLKWKLFRLTQERARVLAEAGPMISQLRALGVMATTHGQTLFQTASRNYRTFQRWRKPAVKAVANRVAVPSKRTTPARAAARTAKRATLPRRAVTAQR